MQVALYGEDGFYTEPGAPAAHFRTAAHSSPLWATAMSELALRLDAAMGSPQGFTVVDLGAGGGELLAGLAVRLSERISLVGVDVAPRPADLPARVHWQHRLPQQIRGLLLAVEWLDVVPLEVVQLTDAGPRLVEVGETGDERLGGALRGTELAWQRRWWPLSQPGDRAEIGLSRDEAWRSATGVVEQGLAVAVDYPAVPDRDAGGTLTGYRSGRQCLPVPDGSCDLTASVLFESLQAPGDLLLSQRTALQQLGIRGTRPVYDGKPADYLRGLSEAGAAAELIDPGGLGGFTWLLHPVGLPPARGSGLLERQAGQRGDGHVDRPTVGTLAGLDADVHVMQPIRP